MINSFPGRWPRVLVFGAGSVGSTFGGFLSDHADVTLLGRKKHLKAISEKGLSISGLWGKFHFERFEFALSEKELAGKVFDLVLLTVKAYDTLSAARALQKIVSPKTLILSLQNGLGNIETLHRFFPKEQVLGGRVIFGAKNPAPGKIEITVMAEPAAIGETSIKKITSRVKQISQWIHRCGIPAAACEDIESTLWRKVIYNCALNPLCSLLNCHYGYLTEKKSTLNVMNEVIREIYCVAKRCKIKLNPASPKQYQKIFYSKLVPRTYHHHPSMLQDLQKSKRTEIDALCGAIADLGKKKKVSVPVNARLAQMIRDREKENL